MEFISASQQYPSSFVLWFEKGGKRDWWVEIPIKALSTVEISKYQMLDLKDGFAEWYVKNRGIENILNKYQIKQG